MKSFIVAALLIVALATVECGGIGGYGLGGCIGCGGVGYGVGLGGVGYGVGLGGIGYGLGGPKFAEGPNILYGGYSMTSRSVSGPLGAGVYKTSFLPGKLIY